MYFKPLPLHSKYESGKYILEVLETYDKENK